MCLYFCCGLCLQFSQLETNQVISLLLKTLADCWRHLTKEGGMWEYASWLGGVERLLHSVTADLGCKLDSARRDAAHYVSLLETVLILIPSILTQSSTLPLGLKNILVCPKLVTHVKQFPVPDSSHILVHMTLPPASHRIILWCLLSSSRIHFIL